LFVLQLYCILFTDPPENDCVIVETVTSPESHSAPCGPSNPTDYLGSSGTPGFSDPKGSSGSKESSDPQGSTDSSGSSDPQTSGGSSGNQESSYSPEPKVSMESGGSSGYGALLKYLTFCKSDSTNTIVEALNKDKDRLMKDKKQLQEQVKGTIQFIFLIISIHARSYNIKCFNSMLCFIIETVFLISHHPRKHFFFHQ